ncbi:MAG: hypothetical protein U0744_12065 [Gemmataceae bacterium]
MFVGSFSAHGQVVGWARRRHGGVSSANPPTEWGVDKNVVWKTPMPSFQCATPVIVGDKIFTCNEPTTLICSTKPTAKIVWERKSLRSEIPWSDEDKQKLAEEKTQR